MLQQDLSGLTLAQKIALALMLVAIIFIIGVVVYMGPRADSVSFKKVTPPPVVNVERAPKTNLTNLTNIKYKTTGGSTIYDSYWQIDSTGLIHQWRSFKATPASALEREHSTFEPARDNYARELGVSCRSTGEKFIRSLSWRYNPHDYDEFDNDEGSLSDFLQTGMEYWVCQYVWKS